VSSSLSIAAESLVPWMGAEDCLRAIAKLKVQFVQLTPVLSANGVNFSERDAQSTASLLRDHGMVGRSMSWFPLNISPERYAVFLRRCAQFAPCFGLRVLNTYLHCFSAVTENPEAAISAYARCLEPVLKKADENDFVVTLEPESFDISGRIDGLQRIVQLIDHPCFKLTFDPCNLYQANEEAFPHAYDVLSPHIAHVHLKNGSVFVEGLHPEDERAFAFAPPKANRIMRWGPIRDGAINMHGLLRRLHADGYAGEIVLEPHSKSLQKQLKFFRDGLALMAEVQAEAGT
jgi:sugar phosphate isomerase/epimerase